MAEVDAFITRVETAILMPIITLLGLFAFVIFVWGVVQFIGAAGDEEKRTTGQKHILWGIIGMVILFGANGIIALMSGTLGSIFGPDTIPATGDRILQNQN